MTYKIYKEVLDHMQEQLKLYADLRMENRYTVVREIFIRFSSLNSTYCKKYSEEK
jgi:hypothetical protein